MDRPSCAARFAQDHTCLAAHQQHQLLLPVQTASLLHGNGSGASRQRQLRTHNLRAVAAQTAQRLQAPDLDHGAAMLNQHRREGDYEAGLVQLQVLGPAVQSLDTLPSMLISGLTNDASNSLLTLSASCVSLANSLVMCHKSSAVGI